MVVQNSNHLYGRGKCVHYQSLWSEGTELLEHFQNVDVNITGEHERFQGVDISVYLLMMLQENKNLINKSVYIQSLAS